MGKIVRNVVLGFAIGTFVAAGIALPAAAKRAPRHYASACDWKRAHWDRAAWCRRHRPPSFKEAEAEALLQCLLSQPFATCD